MEFSIFNRFHDVFTEHKIFDVALWYHNPLAAGKADFAAAVVESFDLLIDTANGLYFSLLVDGAGKNQAEQKLYNVLKTILSPSASALIRMLSGISPFRIFMDKGFSIYF